MTVFSTCVNGHDLTEEGAYIYRNGGLRECRECFIQSKVKKKRSISTTNFSLSHKS